MRFAFDGWFDQSEKQHEPFPWERFHVRLYCEVSRSYITADSEILAALAASGYRLTLEKVQKNGDGQ